MNKFFTKLENRCTRANTNLCIGLDPDPEMFFKKLTPDAEGYFNFCMEIVGATHEFAAAYKPNMAFFESLGVEGWYVLAQVMENIPKDIPIILDAKRGDIGNSSEHYAKSIFEKLGADAVTINPFMGFDSVEPFLKYKDNGVYILCLTSNPGAQQFQLWFDLYRQIAKKIVAWNTRGNCGMVIGATQPMQVSNVIEDAPGIPLLIPGIGVQGGTLDIAMPSVRSGPRHRGLFSVSRSILYASQKKDYARAARKVAQEYRDRINLALEGPNIDPTTISF